MALAKSDFDSWTSFWLVFETWKGLKIGSFSFLSKSDFEVLEEITFEVVEEIAMVDFWNWFSILVNCFPIVFKLVLQKLFCWIILLKFASESFGLGIL